MGWYKGIDLAQNKVFIPPHQRLMGSVSGEEAKGFVMKVDPALHLVPFDSCTNLFLSHHRHYLHRVGFLPPSAS